MSKRLGVSVIAGLVSFSVSAVELEVSMVYSDGYNATSQVSVPGEVIGFYRSLSVANKVFADSGVNLNLVPAKVAELPSSAFSADYTVSKLRAAMDYGVLETATNQFGHFVVGVSAFRTGTAVGNAEPFFDGYYNSYDQNGIKQTKKFAVAAGVMNNHTANDRYRYVLVHELLHTIGGMHTETDAGNFDTLNAGVTYGHGEDCGSGNYSLMHGSVVNGTGTVYMSGTAQCNQGHGDMVRFTNTYAPRVATHEDYLHMNTLKLSVAEDKAEEEFEFTVTRSKNVLSAGTAKVFISGTNTSLANEIQPVVVSFEANELSKMVAVPFSSIHPLLSDASSDDGKVYAAAVADSEVVSVLSDVSSVNTVWTKDTDNNNNNNGGSEDNGGSAESGGGSGGSLGLFGLLALFLGAGRRR